MRRLSINPETANVTVTKTGPGETIAGYATEKYSANTPLTQGEVWVAPASEPPPGYYDITTASAVAQIGAMGQIAKELRDKQVKGFILKMTGTANLPTAKGIPFTQATTSVEKGAILASMFEPPAGYRKVPAE